MSNTSVHDVAAYIVAKRGQMTPMALQKLCFYAQAWFLVWEGEALFPEPIEAWTGGPMVRSLWDKHSGLRNLTAWAGDPEALTASQKASVDRVLALYAGLSAEDLSRLTHEEKPWLDARTGMAPSESGNREITLIALTQFYAAQQRQFNDLYLEFGLAMKFQKGETIMYGRTKSDIETGIDRLSRAICNQSLPPGKKRMLIQSAGRCQYQLL